MTTQEILSIEDENKWRIAREDIYFDGYIQINGNHCDDNDIINIFGKIETLADLKDILQRSNGSFTVAIQTSDDCVAGRGPGPNGPPIFYSETCLSNNYNILQDKLEDEISLENSVRFLTAGNIRGRKTLNPNIFSLQSGQVVQISENMRVEIDEYYPITGENLSMGKGEDLETVLNETFRMIKKVINNRPVIIALSGGYDSRLLAIMLKKHNIDNVYAFTHNLQSDYDVERAREVSNYLGFDFNRIVLTREDISEAFNSDERIHVSKRFGHCGTVGPTPQMISKVEQIPEPESTSGLPVLMKAATPADSVGKFIPSEFISTNTIDEKILVNAIIDKYHSNINIDKTISSVLYKETKSKFRSSGSLPVEYAIDILIEEYRRWRSSLLVYSFWQYFGYEYIEPFSSKRMLNFLSNMNLEDLYNQKKFEAYTEKLNREYCGSISIGPSNSNKPSYIINNKLKNVVKGSQLQSYAKFVLDMVRNLNTDPDPRDTYENDPRFGSVDFNEYNRFHGMSPYYQFFLAKNVLERYRVDVDNSGTELSIQNIRVNN